MKKIVNGQAIDMTAEEVAAFEASRGPVKVTAVAPRQAKLALHNAGLLTAVEAAIAALPEPQKTAAQITWDESLEFQRNNPVLLSLASALGLTSAQVDDLFTAAAAL